ncbi:MAG TPA: hypothetical protein VLH56_16920 [Dissulfurispiraceae bacterium]|nr:hypothetical protein [Dissulfurispiraceae bacterium]
MKQPTIKDRQAIERFRERVAFINESSGDVPADETRDQKLKRIKKLQADYNAFVAYYFGHWASVPSGAFHITAANRLYADTNIMAVMEWARAHAKSTHFNVMIPLWLKARSAMKVMVLVGKNERNAATLLGDIQAELENNHRYLHDFGQQMKYGSWEEGRFATKDGCGFFALGRGQSPRGLRHRQHRPDYIVLDDVDDDELCRNPDRVRQLTEWALKALYFASDMGRARFVVVGNRISNNSLVANIAQMPGVWHYKVNAIMNGKPAWPEKYTLEEIEAVAKKLGYRNAQQELFNNPITEGAVFKQDWLLYEKLPQLHEFKNLVSYCDPSFKNSATSDYKAIITIGAKGQNLFVVNAFVRKSSITEMVRWWYNMHESLPQGVICDYFMEASFLQDLIFEEFTREGMLRGYQLPLRPDTRNKPDKFARIEALSPLFERNVIILNKELCQERDYKEMTEQLLTFEKGSRTHDDAPDALEGAVWMINRRAARGGEPAILQPREKRRW